MQSITVWWKRNDDRFEEFSERDQLNNYDCCNTNFDCISIFSVPFVI